jgi:hypothetical protein
MVSTFVGFLPTEAAASSTMGRDSATRVLRQSANCPGPGEHGSGTAEQVGANHQAADVAARAQDEPERGVGVDALGELGMVGEADDAETRIVGQAGVPEHLAHLVDAGLQPEAERTLRLMSLLMPRVRSPLKVAARLCKSWPRPPGGP